MDWVTNELAKFLRKYGVRTEKLEKKKKGARFCVVMMTAYRVSEVKRNFFCLHFNTKEGGKKACKIIIFLFSWKTKKKKNGLLPPSWEFPLFSYVTQWEYFSLHIT